MASDLNWIECINMHIICLGELRWPTVNILFNTKNLLDQNQLHKPPRELNTVHLCSRARVVGGNHHDQVLRAIGRDNQVLREIGGDHHDKVLRVAGGDHDDQLLRIVVGNHHDQV